MQKNDENKIKPFISGILWGSLITLPLIIYVAIELFKEGRFSDIFKLFRKLASFGFLLMPFIITVAKVTRKTKILFFVIPGVLFFYIMFSFFYFEPIAKTYEKIEPETNSTNIDNSIGGYSYYWLSTPYLAYSLKVNEVVEIPIKIHTPNEIHLEQIKEEMAFEIFKKPIYELDRTENMELAEVFSNFLVTKKNLNYSVQDINFETKTNEGQILEITESSNTEEIKTFSIKGIKKGSTAIWFYIGDISTCVLISVEEDK